MLFFFFSSLKLMDVLEVSLWVFFLHLDANIICSIVCLNTEASRTLQMKKML